MFLLRTAPRNAESNAFEKVLFQFGRDEMRSARFTAQRLAQLVRRLKNSLPTRRPQWCPFTTPMQWK